MSTPPYDRWIDRLERTVQAVRAAGGRADEFTIGPPAKEAEVAATERRIGRRLPTSFRRVLLEFSGSVFVSWFLPGKTDFVRLMMIRLGLVDQEIGDAIGLYRAYSGDVAISLEGVKRAEALRRWTCRHLKRRRVDPGPMARWSESIAFCSENGSCVGLRMDESGGDAAVVTLENEAASEDSCAWLAPNFLDFMERWTRIGGVGPDWRVLDAFIKKPWGGLDPDSEPARAWRAALGLDL